jgi:hypothetical protein
MFQCNRYVYIFEIVLSFEQFSKTDMYTRAYSYPEISHRSGIVDGARRRDVNNIIML